MSLFIQPKHNLWITIFVLIFLASILVPAQPVRASGLWYVAPGGSDSDTCADATHPCAKIQAAVDKAASGDTVYISVGTYTSTSSNGVVNIYYKNLVLSGGWDVEFTSQTGMSTIDGQNTRNGIDSIGTVTLENLIIQNGNYYDSGAGVKNDHSIMTIDHSVIKNNYSNLRGGGIENFGTLTVNDTIIMNNEARSGGAALENYYGTVTINNSAIYDNSILYSGSTISNYSTLILNNSTISQNGKVSTYYSGIIYNSLSLVINNSTIADNIGRGIDSLGNVTIQNSILANNYPADCFIESGYSNAGLTSLGYNIIENNQNCTLSYLDLTQVVPLLGPLQDNGGSTYTQALLETSPAIEGGNPLGCSGSAGPLDTDQRGLPRVGRCDIGAYEAQWNISANMDVTPTSAAPGDLLSFTISIHNLVNSTLDIISLTDPLPGSLRYQDNSLAASIGTAAYENEGISWNGSLGIAGEVEITFNAYIDVSATRGSPITNTATIEGAGDPFTLSVNVDLPPVKIFLPLISKPSPGIYGHVTLNGLPAIGVWIDLCDIATGNCGDNQVQTDSVGNYFFGPDKVIAGRQYVVEYFSRAFMYSDPCDGTLRTWGSKPLDPYVAGTFINMVPFDISDVILQSPAPGASVSLPVTLRWTKRSASPGDSYRIIVYDVLSKKWFSSSLLGYMDNYQLLSLSAGFFPNTGYSWYINIHSPDGGSGSSCYRNPITFLNTGSVVQTSLSADSQRISVNGKGYFAVP